MNPQPSTPPPSRRNDLVQVIRDGLCALPSADTDEGNLIAASRKFFATLDGEAIPHVLVGGLAVLQYVEGRNTRDIDLIIATSDLKRLPDFQLEDRNERFASGTSGPLQVHLRFTNNPLVAEIMTKHSAERRFVGHTLRCATPRGIILLLLFELPSLYRQGNIDGAALSETDILQLLHHHPMDPEELLTALSPHMTPSDIPALREILRDIETRLKRSELF